MRADAGTLARAREGGTASARVESDAAVLADIRSARGSLARVSTTGPLWFVVVTGGSDILMLASVFRVNASSTAYVGPGGVASSIEDVQVPVPAMSILELHCGCDENPGTGSYTYTLMKNEVDTALTFSLTGTSRKGSIAISTAFASGDWLSLRVVASGAAPAAHHSASLKVSY
jgi:hypothetical protein